MDEYDFYSLVMDNILDYLPDEYSVYTVSMEQVTKNNDQVMHGLVIRGEGASMAPIIYMDGYYRDINSGNDMADILKEIAGQYLKAMDGRDKVSVPDLDFDSVKDTLRVKLVNTTSNQELLRNVISKPVECGFSLVPFIDIPMGNDTGGMIQITKKMADAFGYDEKEIMKAAIAGSILNSEPGLYRIEDVLFGGDDKENLLQTVKRDDSLDGILVLTYRDSEFGAASLFFPGMQMRISEVIGDRDYYVLPSSVHELLVLPEAEVHSAEELAKMVQSVNAGMVAPDERLGDKVLHYRVDLDRLSVAVNLEKERDRERER